MPARAVLKVSTSSIATSHIFRAATGYRTNIGRINMSSPIGEAIISASRHAAIIGFV